MTKKERELYDEYEKVKVYSEDDNSMDKKWIVFWIKNERIGCIPKNEQNIMDAVHSMYLLFIQEDITGTIHYEILGLRKSRRESC